VHFDGAKPQNCIVEIFGTTSSQSLLSLPGTVEKNFSFYFKCYNLTIRAVSFNLTIRAVSFNLTIRAVNFFETFCTCSPSSLVQDPTVEIPNIDYYFSSILAY
jgi:hypothetical protein